MSKIEIVNMLVYLFTVIFFVIYVIAFKKNKPSLKQMIVIALLSAMAFILHFIKIISYPQGGGIELVPSLPILIAAVLYGWTGGVTSGIIYGILTLITGSFIVSVPELLLDYILAGVLLGTLGLFNREKKIYILIGAIVSVILSVFANTISGVYFYGQYAPPGMNLWWYSIVYNYSSAGLTGAIAIVLLMFLPLKRFKALAKG